MNPIDMMKSPPQKRRKIQYSTTPDDKECKISESLDNGDNNDNQEEQNELQTVVINHKNGDKSESIDFDNYNVSGDDKSGDASLETTVDFSGSTESSLNVINYADGTDINKSEECKNMNDKDGNDPLERNKEHDNTDETSPHVLTQTVMNDGNKSQDNVETGNVCISSPSSIKSAETDNICKPSSPTTESPGIHVECDDLLEINKENIEDKSERKESSSNDKLEVDISADVICQPSPSSSEATIINVECNKEKNDKNDDDMMMKSSKSSANLKRIQGDNDEDISKSEISGGKANTMRTGGDDNDCSVERRNL
mmetsp:Transcript_75625/g.67838  ORF Transcript_75625/g.67838 Transcript_75625/m.67838 type:complete len:312 (-) Transcript_75625:90-1025(-)|eukprot:CAMPEP_0201580342 /NCGR_PEP_ID=MMETSP0190_2-20130828/43029_1 /ASSEMBLY_ACC=CAM_ASM_000263 /TAXON_ID=37353 /ORGANISM="Rosalina sp." /LENGTH=311 /DNA_ID=CAMNT_0048016193 /DNA_START=61 /DNA_END=996 /DNA_ORIENTATION=-